MDIVYPLIRTKDDNIELRYSLRSIKNIPHDNVYIIWYLPRRIDNVIHIPAKDLEAVKSLNVINKLKTICNDENVSDDFILMNDDFFILNETVVKYYHQWTIAEHIERRKHLLRGKYIDQLYKTKEYFEDWLDYSLHIPYIYNKKKLLKLFEKYDFTNGLLIRNMYGNEYNVGWDRIQDVKNRWENQIEIDPNQLYISSGDTSMQIKEFRDFIHSRFGDASHHELLHYKYDPMEKVAVKLLKSLYPYKKGETATMKTVIAEKRAEKGYLEIVEDKKEIKKVEPKKVEPKKVEKKVEKKATKKVEKKENKSAKWKGWKKNKSL